MTMTIPDAEVLAVLEAIDRGDMTVAVLDDWDDVFAGEVRFAASNGWVLWVFNDCDSWDYLDRAESPDGRVWDYPDEDNDPRSYTITNPAHWRPENRQRWPRKPQSK